MPAETARPPVKLHVEAPLKSIKNEVSSCQNLNHPRAEATGWISSCDQLRTVGRDREAADLLRGERPRDERHLRVLCASDHAEEEVVAPAASR